MRIGKLYIGRDVDRAVRAYLLSLDGRELVARMARSEAKSYLAALAEEASLPFGTPAQFLAGIARAATCTCPDKDTGS